MPSSLTVTLTLKFTLKLTLKLTLTLPVTPLNSCEYDGDDGYVDDDGDVDIGCLGYFDGEGDGDINDQQWRNAMRAFGAQAPPDLKKKSSFII